MWLLTHDLKWLNDEDATKDIVNQKWHTSLCGQIFDQNAYVRGSSMFGKPLTDETHQNKKGVYWEWNPNKNERITWRASPFVYFDDELKVSLLFRVTNLSYDLDVNPTGEYHRFAAEVEPVQRRDISVDDIKSWLPEKPSPEPTEARDTSDTNDAIDTPESLKLEESNPVDNLRTKAEDAFKNRNYKEAVVCYDEMARQNLYNYTHVAKSRHGAALWRLANFSTEDIETRKKNFLRAIDLLDEASKHRDIGYQAEAHYQKSKALWHLAEIDSENKEKLLDTAKDEAEKALGLALEQRYIGWYEWMLERAENIESETETYDSESNRLDSENSNDRN